MKNVVFTLVHVIVAVVLSSCASTPPPKLPEDLQKIVTSPYVPPQIKIDASQLRVVEGAEVKVSWTVRSTDTTIIVELDGSTVRSSGSVAARPAVGANTFHLVVRTSEQEYRDSVIVTVDAKPRAVFTSADTSAGPDDGRFTIGCRGQRLTYGYPAPLSTSHIIVKVNGELATNNPRFNYNDNIRHISGHSRRAGRLGYNRTEIPFRFYGVDVLQRVVPVDKAFKEISDESDAKYYKIEWALTNRQAETVRVGLSYLLDTMIDDNDAAKIKADETRVTFEKRFDGGEVPSTCSIYRRDFDENDLTGLFIIDPKSTRKPTELIIGRWPFLHGLTWPNCQPGVYYYDSAIMTTWDDLDLKADSSVYFAVYYGTKQGHPIIMLDNNQAMKSDVKAFFYELSESRLSRQTTDQINSIVSGRRILAASVSGFSDSQGDMSTNLRVSRERADRVVAQLVSNGVHKDVIMVKAYGESNALQSPDAQKVGNPSDRRVELNVWYED